MSLPRMTTFGMNSISTCKVRKNRGNGIMMKRIFACSLAVLLCILPLISCADNKTLTVTSVDLPALGKLRVGVWPHGV